MTAVSEPFLGEVRMMSFNFAPRGWALCNGQFLPINQNQALFSLLGTTYGGDGLVNFALPDLRSRVPIHFGNGHVLGERAGEAAHSLSTGELSPHSHSLATSTARATTSQPSPTVMLAQSGAANLYGDASNLVAMSAASIASIGGSQVHENRQPYLVLNFCIALQGIFPSQN
jgi:microcystin-dependent protein